MLETLFKCWDSQLVYLRLQSNKYSVLGKFIMNRAERKADNAKIGHHISFALECLLANLVLPFHNSIKTLKNGKL